MTAPSVQVASERASRRSRLPRYGLWQLRDYAISRGAPTFLVAAMFGGLAIFPMLRTIQPAIDRMPPLYLQQMIMKHGTLEAFRRSLVHEAGAGFLHGFIGTVVFLGALFATNGLVSNDRKNGHYRFLFSKPLSPVRYYGQAFLLHWAGFLVVATALGALYGAYVEQVLTPIFLLVLAAMFLMYAGIGFLMTTVLRWDWLGLAVIVIASELLWGRFGKSGDVFSGLLYLLPPIHRTGDVYGALVGGTALPWQSVEWIAAYGAVCVVAGLVVLRTQRLAIP